MDSVKARYLRTPVRGEALRQFDTFSAEVGGTNSEKLKSVILGLGLYFFCVNDLSKEKHAMLSGTMKPRGLEARHYAARMNYLNDYLSMLPGAKLNEIIC